MHTKTLKTFTGTLKISIPENLNELSLGKLIELSENPNRNDIHYMSILSGLPLIELANLINIYDIHQFVDHVNSITHQLSYVYDGRDVPEVVLFGDKKVKVLKNLSIEPWGAFVAARDIMVDEINKHIGTHGEENWKETIQPSPKACAMILAHYFYCRVTGNLYEEQKAEEFFDVVKDLPVQVAMPIARYFFLNYPNL